MLIKTYRISDNPTFYLLIKECEGNKLHFAVYGAGTNHRTAIGARQPLGRRVRTRGPLTDFGASAVLAIRFILRWHDLRGFSANEVVPSLAMTGRP